MRVLSFIALIALLPFGRVSAQVDLKGLPLFAPHASLPEALNGEEVARLVKSVDRGLVALQKLQTDNGAFQSASYGQPAITSLAVIAYLSRGHKPGEGPYGESLERAINYVLTEQKKSGLFSNTEIDYERLNIAPSRGMESRIAFAQSYSHAISMLMLGEVYGLTGEQETFRMREAIDKGLRFTIQLWDIRKPKAQDVGGFRYTRAGFESNVEADVSITGWHAASLRSIRNAGFDIPQSMMERLAGYLIRTQNRDGGFGYFAGHSSTYQMTAAGTLSLVLAGKYDDPSVARAAAFLSRFDARSPSAFSDNHGSKWPYYGCYYITQASIQLGGRVWVNGMRQCHGYLIPRQEPSGFWPLETKTEQFGKAYSTSMAIIALTPPLQLLPIYQR